MWAWWVLELGAVAGLPLPSFREEVARAHWHDIDGLLEAGCGFQAQVGAVVCRDGVTEVAIQKARAFRAQVFDDAGIAYLQGLAHRYAGEDKAAASQWEQAVALDPTYHAAWYDLGELHLVGGRYDQAEAAFHKVAPLLVDTPVPWLGYQRLAEVSALRHDPAEFEVRVKEALRHGFSFLEVATWPNWRTFYADPALEEVFDKLLTVYATPDARRAFEAP